MDENSGKWGPRGWGHGEFTCPFSVVIAFIFSRGSGRRGVSSNLLWFQPVVRPGNQ